MSPEEWVRWLAMQTVKWVADRLLALIALVVVMPICLTIAMWIFFDDGRPILFVQLRAGRHGRPFRMFKFRTMVHDAIEIGRQIGISEDPFGIVRNDPRITRSGAFLRRTSLDELPQLVNVLIGQMSLVGPRPDLVEQAANYTEQDRRRLAVLPGITGWSQIQGRDEIGWPEKIQQDIWYVDNWSTWLDLKIIVKTFAQFARSESNPVIDEMNIERHRRSCAFNARESSGPHEPTV